MPEEKSFRLLWEGRRMYLLTQQLDWILWKTLPHLFISSYTSWDRVLTFFLAIISAAWWPSSFSSRVFVGYDSERAGSIKVGSNSPKSRKTSSKQGKGRPEDTLDIHTHTTSETNYRKKIKRSRNKLVAKVPTDVKFIGFQLHDMAGSLRRTPKKNTLAAGRWRGGCTPSRMYCNYFFSILDWMPSSSLFLYTHDGCDPSSTCHQKEEGHPFAFHIWGAPYPVQQPRGLQGFFGSTWNRHPGPLFIIKRMHNPVDNEPYSLPTTTTTLSSMCVYL